MKNFKITLLTNNIPYKEDTKSWQQIVDIHQCISVNESCTLLEVCIQHDQSPNFYLDISKLIDDKLVKIN